MSNAVLTEPRYLSLAQASAIVNISTRTLRRAIAKGALRASKLGRLWRLESGELHRWVQDDGAAPPASVR